jgi:tetratricopeptide (TPR) repeat protein
MLSFPFEIPPSLYSYLEKFESNPQKTTEKLKTHLQRRGQDPIGEFLLAWFYLQQEQSDAALNHAIRAKAMAPGSPLLQFLPYFIRHPDSFTAWQPSESSPDNQITEFVFAHPRYPNHTDLDALIEQISKVDPQQLRKFESGDRETEGKDELEETKTVEEENVDDIVSETIADIYEKQNRLEKAKIVYNKLAEYYPEKRETYRDAIERIDKRLERENED